MAALLVLIVFALLTAAAHALLGDALPAGWLGWGYVSPVFGLGLVVAVKLWLHGRAVRRRNELESERWLERAIPEAAARRGGELRVRIAAEELGLTPEGAEKALEQFASTSSQSVFVEVDDEGETIYRFPSRGG